MPGHSIKALQYSNIYFIEYTVPEEVSKREEILLTICVLFPIFYIEYIYIYLFEVKQKTTN